MERRFSEGWKSLNASVIPLHERTDITLPTNDAELVYILKDGWTTHLGSWEPDSNDPWAVPQWARDTYLLPGNHQCYNDDGGSEHHFLFAMLPIDWDGGNVGCQLLKSVSTLHWSDDRDHPTSNDTAHKVKPHSGWWNVAMYSSSTYFPDRDQHGPFRWMPQAILCDIAKGAGMPYQRHVSFWAVWQEITWSDYKTHFMDNPPVDPPVDGDIALALRSLNETLSSIDDTLRDWARHSGVDS